MLYLVIRLILLNELDIGSHLVCIQEDFRTRKRNLGRKDAGKGRIIQETKNA